MVRVGRHSLGVTGRLALVVVPLVVFTCAADCHEPLFIDNNNNQQAHPSQYNSNSETSQSSCRSSSIGYLFSHTREFLKSSPWNQTGNSEHDKVDLLLSDVLDRVGPDMRPTSGFKDSPDLSLELARRAWTLMQRHAQATADQRYLALWPLVQQLLTDSNVSSQCLQAAHRTAHSARRLDSWAIQRKYIPSTVVYAQNHNGES